MRQIDRIERETGRDPSSSIIWLHGLGADATDFLPIIDELDLPGATRFVFPNAPTRAVTINGGMVMRAWYDIKGFGPGAPEDTDGLAESIAIVDSLVERERERGIAPGHIVLAGFSQGGAVVLHAGLTADPAIGAILGLSTYLPAAGRLRSAARIATDTPVSLTHGIHDPVIPIALAEASVGMLRDMGVRVDWSTYPMGHEVSDDEIRDLSDRLRRYGAR